ncbi:MAG: HD domain-containing protein [Terriglobia bacterium]
MASEFEVRDPIHGFIYRGSREKKIIDSPLFQRLRRIKQLALASLVYPSAVHTRFEHSIGAMYVAGRIAERLDLGNEHTQILRFAALLHDIGHGPFSHVSEEVLRNVTGSKQAHEEIGYRIILNSPDLDGPLSRDERREIVDLLSGRCGDSVMRSILSGPIDADKQDYLLRDSYFCGVKYGVYDIDRLIQVLCIHSDTNDRFLAISQDGVSDSVR